MRGESVSGRERPVVGYKPAVPNMRAEDQVRGKPNESPVRRDFQRRNPDGRRAVGIEQPPQAV